MSASACSQLLSQAAPWQPVDSALSGADRHDFAVSQGFDIAHGWLADRFKGNARPRFSGIIFIWND
jgi:hypothetical protein